MRLFALRDLLSVISAILLVVAIAFSGSSALEIHLTYKDKGGNPSYDLNGEGLQHVMEVAARTWENAFPDIAETYRIKYYWKEWPSDDADEIDRTADCNLGMFGPRTSRIRFFSFDKFGNEMDWFIDETPRINLRVGDLYQSTVLYCSDGIMYAPYLMEVSYASHYVDLEHRDLYTTAMHEIGHSLGLVSDWPIGKPYIQVDPAFTLRFQGSPVGARIERVVGKSDFLGIKYQTGHIVPETLMGSGKTRDRHRYLPSTTDIFAVAAVNGWTKVNLPRKEIIYRPGTSRTLLWEDWENWLGDRVPDIKSIAYVRDEQIDEVVIGADSEARELYISHLGPIERYHDLDVQLQSNSLTVDGYFEIRIPEDRIGTAEMYMEDGSVLSAEDMRIDRSLILMYHGATVEFEKSMMIESSVKGGTDYGKLTVGCGTYPTGGPPAKVINTDGWIDIEQGILTLFHGEVTCPDVEVDADSYIRGMGSVLGLKQFENKGSIIAENGDLVFRSAGNSLSSRAQMDLDGQLNSPAALIDARNGSITFDGTVVNPFAGSMMIGQYQTLNITSEVRLEGEGVLEFVTSPATYEGTRLILDEKGEIHAGAEESVLNARLETLGHSYITVGTDDNLYLMGETDYGGVYASGDGAIHQVADAVFSADTWIHVGLFNWDGENTVHPAAPSNTTIAEDVYVSLGSRLSRMPSADGHDGIIILERGSHLDVWGDMRVDNLLEMEEAYLTVGYGYYLVNHGTIKGSGHIDAEVINFGKIIGEPPGLEFHMGCRNEMSGDVKGDVTGCP